MTFAAAFELKDLQLKSFIPILVSSDYLDIEYCLRYVFRFTSVSNIFLEVRFFFVKIENKGYLHRDLYCGFVLWLSRFRRIF